MPLACITPSRRRWSHLVEQAKALSGQLSPDDKWVIMLDDDAPETENHFLCIRDLIGDHRLIWLNAIYDRPDGPTGMVNRLHNAAAAIAPECDLVELDDHDRISANALAEIRHAFEAGYEYCFGWHAQIVAIEQPDGSLQDEAWPTVQRDYTAGAFGRHEYDAIGLRAIKRSLWNKLGGWGPVFPGGHYDLAVRAEAAGARIICLQQSLCCVRVEVENSICGLYHQF